MYRKTVLDNGLRILTVAMPHVRSVGLGFLIGVGSRYESEEEAGASHFIEHMLFKGTEKRPTSKDLAVAIEGIGGFFNASTGRELTVYYAKVARPHLAVAVDVLVDMLRHSLFNPEEVEKERRIIIEEINMVLDSPEDLVQSLNYKLLWPDHPLGRDVMGTKESVSAMQREALLEYMQRYYTPGNIVFSIAGDIEHEAIVEYMASCFNGWQSPGSDRGFSFLPAMGLATESGGAPHLCLHHRETEQTHLCLSVPGLSRHHPERFALHLLNTILGEGMSSRLFLEIRERQGLAYSIDSYVSSLHDTGALTAYAGVDPCSLPMAITAILREWDRLREEPVPEEELVKAKEFIKGQLILQMENSSNVAAWYGRQELLLEEIMSVDEVIEAIEAVSAAELQSLSQKLFCEEKLHLTVVGPLGEKSKAEMEISRLLKL